MDVKRRDFVAQFAPAAVLLLAAFGRAAGSRNANNAPQPNIDSHIETSIKANFGGGFRVEAHSELSGITYADIEHFGNRYTVATSDLLDWRVVRVSSRTPGLDFSSARRLPMFSV